VRRGWDCVFGRRGPGAAGDDDRNHNDDDDDAVTGVMNEASR
jgi:hypothetical protein